MTSFRFDVGARSRFISRLVGRVRNELLKAVNEAGGYAGVSRADIAERTRLSEEEIDKLLSGESSLSLRHLAELLEAIGQDALFEVKRPTAVTMRNHIPQTTTLQSGQIMTFGAGARSSTTIAVKKQAIRKLVYETAI